MDCKANPESSLKAMRVLEKGLCHHHTQIRSICMQKPSGEKAVTDEENARVFANHFANLFNNPYPPPYDDSVLPYVPQCN
eukprot:10076097-Ditylum_brightwellii.AAC.1